MSETVLVCQPCLEHGRGERQPVQVAVGWDDDGQPRAWEWRCPLCHAIVSLFVDFGTLGPDLIRTEFLHRGDEVKLYYEPPT